MNRALVFAVIFAVAVAGFLVYYNRAGLFPEPVCGMENCHGLDVTCGVPAECEIVYQFGDNCRRFASCSVVNGVCQLIKQERFEQCKACVEECSRLLETDYIRAFECEYRCTL